MGFENAELVFSIANVIAFGLSCFFAMMFIGGYLLGPDHVPPLKIDDKFDLGYIRDDKPSTLETSSNTQYYATLESVEIKQKKKKKKNKKKKPVQKPAISPAPPKPIVNECIEAMIALGEKKSQARATVNKYFVSNPKTKTVDEFISGVFKK